MTRTKTQPARPLVTLLTLAALVAVQTPHAARAAEGVGERVYMKHCVSCHGKAGVGVKGEYSKPLVGDKSVAQLAKYIDKWMPEEEPKQVTGDDALHVARYMHEAFYSPIAQARNRPPQIEPVRLTARQYRNAVADLVAHFRPNPPRHDKQGLRGRYYKSRRIERRPVYERVDATVKFDLGPDYPDRDKFDPKGFTVRWTGSVIAPDTGRYEFTIKTDHAFKLWINADDRDTPTLDRWVKSGNDTEHKVSVDLVGGRAVPITLEFSSYRQGVGNSDQRKNVKAGPAFVELWWKRPHAVAEVVPARHLSPNESPRVFAVTTPFPADDRSVGYERGMSASKAWAESVTGAALETARYVEANLRDLAGIQHLDPEDAPKLREFCVKWVEHAFRRPMTDAQRKLYVDRQFEGTDVHTALKRVVFFSLTSPRFLYADFASMGGDAYDTAERLALTMWDSIPDRALLDAAKSGQLKTTEQVRQHAQRMLNDPRARAKMRQFLHHWLDIEHTHGLPKSDEFYPDFNEHLAHDLRDSLDLFMDDIVWGDRPDFRRLLSSREFYANGRLASYYGLELPADAEFMKVDAGSSSRMGVLTHPYILARFSYDDTTSPIHRGVFLVRSVLGRGLRPPPVAVAPTPADLHPGLTTRQRVELQTKPDACRGCHIMINSLGFTLEHYDAVGRWRDKERDKPIDATGAYEVASGETVQLDGAKQLVDFVTASPQTHRAFVVQLYHHMAKQSIMAYGTSTPDELTRSFAGQSFDIRKLMVEIAVRVARGKVQNKSGP